MFYSAREWRKNGYADCVEFWTDPETDSLVVEVGTINRETTQNKIAREFGMDAAEVTVAVEIEFARSQWGMGVCEDFGGAYRKHFKRVDGDLDEDKVWTELRGWMEGLTR